MRVNYSHFDWKNRLAVPALANTPNYVFPSLVVGQRRNYPQEFYQNTWSVRYDLTTSKGAHDLKFGAEYLRWHDTGSWELLSRGEFIFNSTPADVLRRFPVDAWNDPTRWDVTGLDSIACSASTRTSATGPSTSRVRRIALWVGDTWKINNSFTINGGVRWDADFGALDPPHITTTVTFDPRPGYVGDTALSPGERLYPGDLRDINNIAPRGGFTWNVGGNGSFVVRGGSGLYFSIPDSNTTFSIQSFNGERILVNSFPNDGQPGFIQDPTRGVTADMILSGQVPLPAQSPRVIASDYKMPYTWQSTIGFQTQFGTRLGVGGGSHPLERLQLRPAARPEPGVQPADRLQHRADADDAARPEVRQDPVARVDRRGRLPRPLERDHQALRGQLAGRPDLHLHVLHERQHHQLPVRGQQPLRSGCRVGAIDRLPASTPCG